MSFPGFMILLGSRAVFILFIVIKASIPSSFSRYWKHKRGFHQTDRSLVTKAGLKEKKIRAYLVAVFENCFLFSRTKRTTKTCLVPKKNLF